MMHDPGQTLHGRIRRSAFSEKIWRCLDRSTRGNLRLRASERAEIQSRLAQIGHQMPLAEWERISSILDVNPKSIQIVDDLQNDLPGGVIALLPLNHEGMRRIVSGNFSGKEPDPACIAPVGEAPEAIYVWLIHMPGSFGRLLSAFASALEDYLDTPVPIFSRAVSEHSARLQAASGFVAANQFYPACDPDLLVVLPVGKPVHAQLPETGISIAIARSIEDVFKVFAVRSATYIAEQYCSYDEEFDGNDFCATHLLGSINGDAAGCLRLRFFNGFAKLERLAVREEYRQSKLAFALVRAGIAHCAKKGYARILGHSRSDLVRFWRTFGFRVVEGRPAFSFANIEYVEILREGEVATEAISMNASPFQILRPEGAWHRPGIYEASTSNPALDARRRKLIDARVRRVAGAA